MKKYLKVILFIILASLILVGCTSTLIVPDGEVTPNDELETMLQIGVLPTVDSVPIYLAEENGYFDGKGLDVEIETFSHIGITKDSFQGKCLDGIMMSLMEFLDHQELGINGKIVMSTDGVFPLVWRGEARDTEPIRIGLTKKRIGNYLGDKYLNEYQLEKILLSDETLSIQLLEAGEIDAAILPEPLATIAQFKGLEKSVEATRGEYTPNVMVFTEEALKNKKEAIDGFIVGYNLAVKDINAAPEIGKAILVNELGLDSKMMDAIILPYYNEARLPLEVFIQEIADWMSKIEERVIGFRYTDIVVK